jgi:hypothetical protein
LQRPEKRVPLGFYQLHAFIPVIMLIRCFTDQA